MADEVSFKLSPSWCVSYNGKVLHIDEVGTHDGQPTVCATALSIAMLFGGARCNGVTCRRATQAEKTKIASCDRCLLVSCIVI